MRRLLLAGLRSPRRGLAASRTFARCISIEGAEIGSEAGIRRNILWGLFNLVVAYLLLVVVGGLELRRVADVAIAATGFGLGALFIARSVTKMQRERDAAIRPG